MLEAAPGVALPIGILVMVVGCSLGQAPEAGVQALPPALPETANTAPLQDPWSTAALEDAPELFDADVIAALLGRNVIVLLTDGNVVRGRLLRGTTTKLVVETPPGDVVLLRNTDVTYFKVDPADTIAAPPTVAPMPVPDPKPEAATRALTGRARQAAMLRADAGNQTANAILWLVGGGAALGCSAVSAFGGLFVGLWIVLIPASLCGALVGLGMVGWAAVEFLGSMEKRSQADRLESAVLY